MKNLTKQETARRLSSIYMREYRKYMCSSISVASEEANKVFKRLMRLSKGALNNTHIICVGWREQGSNSVSVRLEVAEYVHDVLVGVANSCVLGGIGTHYVWISFCRKDEYYTYSGIERLDKIL